MIKKKPTKYNCNVLYQITAVLHLYANEKQDP